MRRLVLLDLGGVEQQRNCEVRKMSQSWGRAVALCEWMKLLWGGDIGYGSDGSWGLCMDWIDHCTLVAKIIEISEAP